ncbi:MAG: NUDIX hydrolase [Planctomycetes bacterium]|nr:NUDIX hydrolase [Planctomycetota bacterium]MCW8135723.1 NUDIX hydrolase [Planctomycetota bacterium]
MQLSRQRVYEGKAFNIARVTLQNDQGQQVAREVIEHPGAACIIPMLDNDTVLLIEQWRIGAKKPLWEIPAGTLDPGEDPMACAARELEEETGYRAGKLEHLFTMFPSPGILDEKMHIFVATGLTPGTQKLDADEDITAKPFTFKELRIQLKANNIKDGKTIAALGYLMVFKPFLGQ